MALILTTHQQLCHSSLSMDRADRETIAMMAAVIAAGFVSNTNVKKPNEQMNIIADTSIELAKDIYQKEVVNMMQDNTEEVEDRIGQDEAPEPEPERNPDSDTQEDGFKNEPQEDGTKEEDTTPAE